jgi:hypothetical protein
LGKSGDSKPEPATKIGTLNEKPLHEALKKWYARSGDKFEVPVDGSIADIVRGSRSGGRIIEIQTRNFSAIRRKLEKLLTNHPVRLVYPIPAEKWIVKPGETGAEPVRRRSPKRGGYEEIFSELVYIPHLLKHPNFTLDLLLIREEEAREYDGVRGWRKRGWVTNERRLLEVVGHKVIRNSKDLSALIPRNLPKAFTTAELAAGMKKPKRLAQQMVYCLRLVGCIEQVGKRGNAILYSRTKS